MPKALSVSDLIASSKVEVGEVGHVPQLHETLVCDVMSILVIISSQVEGCM